MRWHTFTYATPKQVALVGKSSQENDWLATKYLQLLEPPRVGIYPPCRGKNWQWLWYSHTMCWWAWQALNKNTKTFFIQITNGLLCQGGHLAHSYLGVERTLWVRDCQWVLVTLFSATPCQDGSCFTQQKFANVGQPWNWVLGTGTPRAHTLYVHTVTLTKKPHHFCTWALQPSSSTAFTIHLLAMSYQELLDYWYHPLTHPFLDSPAIPNWGKALNFLWVSSFHEAERVLPVRKFRGILSRKEKVWNGMRENDKEKQRKTDKTYDKEKK